MLTVRFIQPLIRSSILEAQAASSAQQLATLEDPRVRGVLLLWGV